MSIFDDFKLNLCTKTLLSVVAIKFKIGSLLVTENIYIQSCKQIIYNVPAGFIVFYSI